MQDVVAEVRRTNSPLLRMHAVKDEIDAWRLRSVLVDEGFHLRHTKCRRWAMDAPRYPSDAAIGVTDIHNDPIGAFVFEVDDFLRSYRSNVSRIRHL